MKKEPRQLHPNRQKAGAHLAVVVPKSDDLRELERVVDDHVHSGIPAGRALARIRDEEFYRQEGFKSFEGYLKANAGDGKRWTFSRRYAFRLMSSAEVAKVVAHGTLDLPPITVERHARELSRLPEPEQQEKAWAAAVEAAGEGPVRATLVAKEVAKLLPPPVVKEKKPAAVTPRTEEPSPSTPARTAPAEEDEGEGGYEDPVGAEMLFRVDIERELDDVADRWFARCSERETLAQILINLADELRRRDANP